jgi:hypothetical protein
MLEHGQLRGPAMRAFMISFSAGAIARQVSGERASGVNLCGDACLRDVAIR